MAEEIPDLVVEQLALDMLPAEEAADVRAQLLRDADPRLNELQASNAEILELYPPDMIADRLRRKLEAEDDRRDQRWWVPLLATGALAAAAVLLWWMRAPALPESGDPGAPPRIAKAESPPMAADDGVRIKGTERLIIQRKTNSGSTALVPGQTVRSGELVQLAYEAGDAKHGVIASVDGSGAVTLHWPAEEDADTTLAEGTAWLDHSFEFDDAPGFERFVFVTSTEPVSPALVLDALRELDDDHERREGALVLPPGQSQATFLLNKPE